MKNLFEFKIKKIIKNADIKLIFIFVLYLIITLQFLNFVPIWDGRVYFDNCLYKAITTKFNLFNFNCFNHPSMFYMLLIGGLQYFDLGNVYLLNLSNIILGLIGIYAFFRILKLIFKDKTSDNEIYLLTVIFAFHPSFLSNIVHLNLDFGTLVFFLIFLYYLFNNNVIISLFLSLGLIFSKESGIILYILSLIFFVVFTITRNKKPFKKKLILILKKFLYVIPLFIFFLFISYKEKLLKESVFWAGYSLNDIIKNFFIFNLFDKTYQSYLFIIFVSSFNWIISIFLLSFIVKSFIQLIFNIKIKINKQIQWSFIATAFMIFFFGIYFLTSFKTFLNARYFLPLLPLFLIVSYYCLLNFIQNKKIRYAVLFIIFFLMFLSNFKTIDPISKKIFGTFNFGNHKVLKITSITNECCGYGRDQLVYNFEFTNFHYLQNKIYANVKPNEKTYIVSHSLANFFLSGRLRRDNFERTLKLENTFSPKYLTVFDLINLETKPKDIFYVEYPNFNNNEEIGLLTNFYDKEYLKFFDNNSYYIGVYKFKLKDKKI